MSRDSDVILSTIVTDAMLEVYYMLQQCDAMKLHRRNSLKYRTPNNRGIRILYFRIFSHFLFTLKCTSNMAARFCAQCN